MKTFEDYDHSFFGYSTEEFLYQAFENYNKKIFDAEERLDESDSIENIESNVVTYAHPYISDEISPIVLYDDGHNYNLYFRNATENVQNLSLKLKNIPYVINSSRSIIYASGGKDFGDAARKAALSFNNKIKKLVFVDK